MVSGTSEEHRPSVKGQGQSKATLWERKGNRDLDFSPVPQMPFWGPPLTEPRGIQGHRISSPGAESRDRG